MSQLAALLLDPIFQAVPKASLARILPDLTSVNFEVGHTLYTAGATAETLFLVLDGEVALHSPQGKIHPLIGPRCGEESASDTANYVNTAIATTAVRALGIPRRALQALVKAHPALKTDLLLSLASHMAGEMLARPAPPPKPIIRSAVSPIKTLGWLLTLCLPLLVLEFGDGHGLSHNAVLFLAIFSATVCMWIFSLVDDYIPGLFSVLAVLITGLVPAPIVLSGFASDGFLMAMSTLALGTVVVTSGLSYRLMLNLLLRLPNHQFWHFVGLFGTGTLLTPILPTANGRIALVAPFLDDMIDSLRFEYAKAAANRLSVACFGGISIFSAMVMTSKSVNFAVYGLLSPQGQDHFQWITWLIASLVAAFVVLVLYGLGAAIWFRNTEIPQLPKTRVAQQISLLGALKPREWAAISGILFMVVGIVTSSIHKVQPPWLGFTMLFGLLLFGMLHKKEFKEKVDWTFLLYLSGVTGIVGAFNYLGIDKALGDAMPGLGSYMRSNFELFILLLFALINLVRLAVPINATIVILAAIFMPLADINGINAWVLGFIILLFAETWFLPYQCSYYLQLQELNKARGLYNEKSFLLFNALMNFTRLAAVYASLPYWKMLGLL